MNPTELAAVALRAELIASVEAYNAFERVVWARAAHAMATGMDVAEIAELIGVSSATVYRRVNRLHAG